jgi:hypothetical protein
MVWRATGLWEEDMLATIQAANHLVEAYVRQQLHLPRRLQQQVHGLTGGPPVINFFLLLGLDS